MRKRITVFGFIAIFSVIAIYAQSVFVSKNPLTDSDNPETDQDSLKNKIKDGDIIFHTSLSDQSKVIQLATGSKYSHCALIFKDGKEYVVFEAAQIVKRVPLNEWIARGQNSKYVVKRLKNADQILTPITLAKMKAIGKSFDGKSYDLTFEWNDNEMYCSELIWKIYQRTTGLEIGKLQRLGTFDISSHTVQNKIKERYGNHVPLDELVISPAAIFNSDLLTTVATNED
ncbi:YiiX family permuted papain-like enzyme [Olivibacter sp. SDN3]|uniref:YiiX family permuted papain-like enzyme n=1 Tax=Olivibacter sp. SDN3 TaxID=2764720 RepID=UPI00165143E8|nr:YiiX family permuted papain-like enzyme [Olivibacter sp. SDN3]QNL51101.1 YiiX family permuted papain-like enzyme [Olivibacter sp. SDN3]